MTVQRVFLINLASRNYRLIYGIRSGFMIGSALLSGLAMLLICSAFSTRANISEMERKISEVSAQEDKVGLILEERERLVRHMGQMAALLDARGFSWTRLLSRIEEAVPVGVALVRVKFNPKDRTLSLEGAAGSPEALRNLMVGLERSSSFKDPLLKHQSVEKGRISFNVVAVYLDGEDQTRSR